MTGSHQTLTLLLFSAVVAATLAITSWAGSRRPGSAEEFYAGGRLFSPVENGFAIAGDYMSAASFLGISGLIALYGYDGMLYSIGFLVAWLVVLLLVAELVRNCGRFTLADVVAARMRERPVRVALGASSVTVSVLYLVAQMVGAGSLVGLLLGNGGGAAHTWTVLGVGALMIIYVCLGGMRATTWIQIVKAVLLMGGALGLTVLVLVRFGGDPGALLTSAAERSGHGKDFLAPGLRYGGGWTSRFDFISLGLALVLGTAGLPHILARFYTVPTARAARRSVVWAIGLIGSFYLMTIVLGSGAAALVGTNAVRQSSPAGNTAVPLLSEELGGGAGSTGGAALSALAAAVAFATILAVVAGITLAASAAVAHDLYASLRGGRAGRPRRLGKGGKGRKGRPGRRGERTEAQDAGRSEVVVAKVAAGAVGAVAVGLSLLAQELNVAFLVGLAFAVAASANLPVLLYALFWRRFTTRGAVWAVYGGLVPSVALVVLSPVVSGAPQALFPGMDFACFPLENPGLVSIPLGFLAGWLGTVLSREHPDEARHAETEVRSLTGAGAV
ncbi:MULTISPECIES: cation acetate symporter [unclassified Streptomyces]|uniref:solute symporter family protein n=1 Tax=unclassified Streptomyces TaxID=2593676 RepID=UPI002DDBFA9A|nr:cation acetate symporter [Streptomyces sp. NBC_01795]WSA91956.1 cation acetate symporter [Streptomyces sp. NBC_01795]WSS44245.1 cation acetate symporter [Streptomyces sp. NBC_01187]